MYTDRLLTSSGPNGLYSLDQIFRFGMSAELVENSLDAYSLIEVTHALAFRRAVSIDFEQGFGHVRYTIAWNNAEQYFSVRIRELMTLQSRVLGSHQLEHVSILSATNPADGLGRGS